jgi:hypothetical protein
MPPSQRNRYQINTLLMSFLPGKSDVVEWLAVGLYGRGLSTRDIEDACRKRLGIGCLAAQPSVN